MPPISFAACVPETFLTDNVAKVARDPGVSDNVASQ
jgi:hypothetical protein